MKQTKTFAEQYEIDRPLREVACQKYYENKLKTQDIEAAKKQKKYGNWLCSVTTPMGYKFYTRTEIKEKWVKAGWVLGMWNELTLIEKN